MNKQQLYSLRAKFHYAILLANQLASWSATCWRADNVMEFGLSRTI